MAERRMFSNNIINSARFLRMPNEAQNLYFHLGMRADDDGVVEGFTVIRQTGINEDNLKVLAMKGFVKVLNEDLVTFITDWTEHNKIRADRKKNSIYKELLLEICPQLELKEPKVRADRKKDGTSQCQPMDGIGKDRLGKVSIGEERLESIGLFINSLKQQFNIAMLGVVDQTNIINWCKELDFNPKEEYDKSTYLQGKVEGYTKPTIRTFCNKDTYIKMANKEYRNRENKKEEKSSINFDNVVF